MPIYEYRCKDCGRKVSILFRSIAETDTTPACPNCGSERLNRLISRVWTHRNRGQAIEPSYEEDGVPFYGPDVSGSGLWDEDDTLTRPGSTDEEDIAALARETRAMAAAMGEPLDTAFDQALRQVEQGADPDDVFGELDEREQSSSDTES